MLQRDGEPPLGERQRRMIDEAERSCQRLVALIAELSEIQKLDTDLLQLAQQDVDAFAVMGAAAQGVHESEDRNVRLEVRGPEGYVLTGVSSISKISRDPGDLVAQMIGVNHQYPDGAVLFLGTMFAPIEDRDEKGKGFTHKIGDIVTISTPGLGSLTNRMVRTSEAPPWTFGASHLMRNLAKRGLL